MYVKYRSELNYQLFDCDERTLGDMQFSLHPFWNGNGPVLKTITRDLGEVHLTASPTGFHGRLRSQSGLLPRTSEALQSQDTKRI